MSHREHRPKICPACGRTTRMVAAGMDRTGMGQPWECSRRAVEVTDGEIEARRIDRYDVGSQWYE
ncbi:MAG: hypothetical protein F4103_07250 [Boseongicola sp. SB0673_bin_14]|nr:hypothetical protein [Gammaproteobacteria bacterium]MYI68536.1 hypothetical protein [Boseongicola sp. SB0673_bin_14]